MQQKLHRCFTGNFTAQLLELIWCRLIPAAQKTTQVTTTGPKPVANPQQYVAQE